MSRPPVPPEVLAELAAAAPSRVAQRLDAAPRSAESFGWTEEPGRTLVDAGSATVTLTLPIASVADITCTCLLSPRCFHVLAVLRVLPLAAPAPTGRVAVEPDATGTSALAPAARAAGEAAYALGATVLAAGLARIATIRLGELLRVAHGSRRAGLPRLEAALLAVFEAARDLREDAPSFALAGAARDLAELLLVADRIARGDAAFAGVARRSYVRVTGLVLAGIASAPVLRHGYAGIVTYFTDGERIYSAADVQAGELARAEGAYDAALRFGEVSLTHRAATAAGLLFARAEVTAEGRLGAGKDVVCAAVRRAPDLVERHFAEPLHAQAERADRLGLVFAEGVVVPFGPGAGLARDGGGVVPLVVPIDDRRFDVRGNLARLVGVRVRLVGRLDATGGAVEPLAGILPDGAWFSFPYDRVAARDLPRAPEVPALATAPVTSPPALEAARRRVLRFALGGSATLPGAAWPAVAREAAELRRALLFTAADGLEALAAAGAGAADPTRIWLALHRCLATLDRRIARHGWQAGAGG